MEPDNLNEHFQCSLRVAFALKVLNETKSVNDFLAPNAYSAAFRKSTCNQFKNAIVRCTVLFLWINALDSQLLERFLIGLVESHGLYEYFFCNFDLYQTEEVREICITIHDQCHIVRFFWGLLTRRIHSRIAVHGGDLPSGTAKI